MTSKTQEFWSSFSEGKFERNIELGTLNTETLLQDPKRLGFVLARYKFALKMFSSCQHVIEIGCGEALGALYVCSDTKAQYTGVDFEPPRIEYNHKHLTPLLGERAQFFLQDIVEAPLSCQPADGLMMLDVIEHIHPDEEKKFLTNSFANLKERAVAVIGTPNITAAEYASSHSRESHINLFNAERLTDTLKEHFEHVFMFSMNDEIVHTGYSPMAHYLMALCVR